MVWVHTRMHITCVRVRTCTHACAHAPPHKHTHAHTCMHIPTHHVVYEWRRELWR